METVQELWHRCAENYKNTVAEYGYGGYAPYQIITRLTNDEYRLLVENKHDPYSMEAFPPSGAGIHRMMGTLQPIEKCWESHKWQKTIELNGKIVQAYDMKDFHLGSMTPRYGFYKVIKEKRIENTEVLVCYYNMESCEDFIKEEVLINKSNFYTSNSIGPKSECISTGMIIQVLQPTHLVQCTYIDKYTRLGKTYKSWKVTWNIIKQ